MEDLKEKINKIEKAIKELDGIQLELYYNNLDEASTHILKAIRALKEEAKFMQNKQGGTDTISL